MSTGDSVDYGPYEDSEEDIDGDDGHGSGDSSPHRSEDSDAEEGIEDYGHDSDYSSPYRSYDHSYSSDDVPLSKRSRLSKKRDITDRISALPDSVIVQILSLLPTLDSIRTSVLSRRWEYLWTYVPSLYFNYYDKKQNPDSDYLTNISDFVNFVDKTLVLCDCAVKNLRVSSDYERQVFSSARANLWARFAKKNGVEKFELDFTNVDDFSPDDDMFVLPQSLYTNSKFKELRFWFCRMEPKKTVVWNSLKKLSIGYVNLGEDVIQMILSGAPLLEILELHHFICPNRLNIESSSVKKLILKQQWRRYDEEHVDSLEISAPNVQSVEISGEFNNCKLVDIKSLKEATLFDLYLNYSSNYDLVTKARQLLNSLAHVETLTLGSWAMKGLAMLHTKRSFFWSLKCESLTIDSVLWMSHSLAIAVLLRYFPLLQMLIFTRSLSWDRWGHLNTPLRSVEEELSAVPVIRGDFSFLKTVRFIDFCNGDGSVSDYELVKMLLKNAKVLAKMIIHTGTRNYRFRNPNELFKAAQKLLGFQRASPNAEVLIYE